MTPAFTYRKELDGLRAIAVLAVIVYHAELSWKGFSLLPGGFLGVDIFFVLSGYLITGILWEKNRSLFSFYKGRVDRIYPALLLLLFFSSLVSYKILIPGDLLATVESIKGSLGFYANYIFMHEDSYIAESSKYKPLLHIWSLGVEWQFYLAFPLLILFIKKFFAENLTEILVLLIAASFFYCLHLLDRNSTYAFYSTPSRIWELFAGGLAYQLSKNSDNSKLKGGLATTGVIVISYSFLFYKDSDNHPGFISLVAVLGSMFYIVFVNKESLVYKVLSFKPVVYLGLISYSLYLYHQPLQVYYRFYFGEFGNKVFLVLLALTFILAYLSYKFFEDPMRKSKNNFKYLVLLTLALVVYSFANGAINTKGYPKRQPQEIRDALSYFSVAEYRALLDDNNKSCNMLDPKDACYFDNGKPHLVAVGDSFVGVFTRILKEQKNFISLTSFQHEQCPLMSTPLWFSNMPNCWEINKARWAELKKLKSANVLLGVNYNYMYNVKHSKDNFVKGESNLTAKASKETAYNSFKGTIEKLIYLGHKPIVLLMPPRPNIDVRKELVRKVQSGILYFKNEYNAESTSSIDKDVRLYLKGLDVSFIDLNDRMCDKDKGCLIFNEKGGLYNGGQHLSYYGAELFIKDILKNIGERID
ncbi:acyltransferase family protein [Marinospirillum minutulum]|uniref:acyltransferase family protein n=1 Tax=Marinospirillum minutulum TaxID=64974 RepID=UPI00041FC65D|nr:acyltransferase family protein [Marinospirillum minutulum]